MGFTVEARVLSGWFAVEVAGRFCGALGKIQGFFGFASE
jgi:hypothetical protein